jgi:signal transduction histidine kinase/CheY-like chemotaxis protein
MSDTPPASSPQEMDDLRRQLTPFIDLLALLPIPTTLIDCEGVIQDVNQAFLDYARRFFHDLHREDRIGRHVADFCTQPDHRERMTQFLDELRSTGEPSRLVMRVFDQGLREEIFGIPLKSSNGQVIGAALLREDVTAAMLQERMHAVITSIRSEVLKMTRSRDIEQVLAAIHAGLGELGVSFNACGMSIIDADTDPPQVRCCNITHDGRWLEVAILPESASVLLHFWRGKQTVYRRDLHREDGFGEDEILKNAFSNPVRSVVDVPFSHGTLAVNSTEPDAFSPADIEIIEEMAQVLSAGFVRLDDFQKLEQRTRELELEIAERQRRETHHQARTRVRDAVWRMQSVDETVQLLDALNAALKIAGVSYLSCGINIVDVASDEPSVRFYNLSKTEWEEDEAESSRDIILKIWRGGQIIYRRDLELEDPYREREVLGKSYDSRVRSVIDIPFSHGTLAINSTEPDAFSPADIDFLQELANVLEEGVRRLDDIRRLQDQERQLLQSQKMEVVGRLAGGVAHDFNNMLTAILGASEQLLQDCTPEDRPELELVFNAGQKAAYLTHQLLAFSRQQVLRPKLLDLNEVIGNQAKMVRRLIGEDIQLTTPFDPQLRKVEVDPGQIEQVVLNLIINARDAMPRGGRLTVSTRSLDLEHSRGSVPPGSYVLLSVTDTGEGMDRDTRERIFEPFFTTKDMGKGTGLGLSTVYGIVAQSGGHITVRSAPGQGSTFDIYLPQATTDLPEEQEQKSSHLPRGTETILVVEDDALVRRVARRILASVGYTVLEAPDGHQALQIAADHSGEIDILLTDVIMPGMNGKELAERMISETPGTKVIFMSGYVDNLVVHQEIIEPGIDFLQKPFDVKGLLYKVREALDG